MNNLPLKITQLIVSLVVMIAAIVFNFWKLPYWLAWLSMIVLWSGFIAPWAWLDKCISKRQAEVAWLLGQAAWALPISGYIITKYSESGYSVVMLVCVIAAIGWQYLIFNSFMGN